MNLTNEQLKIQEEILLRLHPGKSLEEAKEIESNVFWSLWYDSVYRRDVDYKWEKDAYWNSKITAKYVLTWRWIYTYLWELKRNLNGWHRRPWIHIKNIIWLPPTLQRVLKALGFDFTYMLWDIVQITSMKWATINWRRTVCKWNLLKEDCSDATLRDQSIETQDKICELLKKFL